MVYAGHVSNKDTPQSEIAKKDQIKNKAGGYVFKVDDWTRLNRFLIIGSEGGSYYASERNMAFDNYEVIKRCLALDSKRTVNTIVSISDGGRAVKNAPAIFALAVCSVFGDQKTRAYANSHVSTVARFATDLFTWVDNVLKLKDGKKAKGLLKAIGRWYTEKDAVKVAYQICKYPGRSIAGQRWRHADLLRMAKPAYPLANSKTARAGKALTIPSKDHGLLFHYACHGIGAAESVIDADKTPKKDGLTVEQFDALKTSKLSYVWAHEKCKNAISVKEIVKLIEEFGLTRESVSPELRNNKSIQAALLPRMPMTALIRNLGQMTASGLLKSMSAETKLVINKITDGENLRKARIHPMTVFLALKTYASGSGMRTSWEPVSQLRDAMEDAFYAAFNYVEPTGKNYLLGVDVSGSMGWSSFLDANNNITAREAAAVMAMVIARTEKNYDIMAFAHTFRRLDITVKDSLDTVIKKTSSLSFGGTDCALPMIYASKKQLDVDAFVVLTDNETWFGSTHPFQALKSYRSKFNKEAKLAVLAFTANEFSIADPTDAGMLDIAGLDSNVPRILSEFVSGRL